MHALNTPDGLLSNHPVLWMALPLMVGIAAGDVLYAHLSFHTWPLLLGAVMACLGATASALVRSGPSARRPALFGLFVLLFFFFTGCALLVADRDRTAVRWPALHDVTTRAVIVETPRAGQRSVTATVSLADGPWRHRHVRLTLPTRGDDRPGRLRVGQTLLVRTRIEAPHNFAGSTSTFDYAAYLRRQGIAGQAYCPPWRWVNLSAPGDERGLRPEKLSQRQKFLTQRQNFLSQRQDEQGLHLLPPGERLRVRAIALRDRMAERYAPHLTGSELGVVAAMTLNDNRHLDRDVRDVYAQTGASHVLSLSGLHLTILFSLVLGLAARDQMTAGFYSVPVLLVALVPMFGMADENLARIASLTPLGGIYDLMGMAVDGTLISSEALSPLAVTVAWIAAGCILFAALFKRVSRDN